MLKAFDSLSKYYSVTQIHSYSTRAGFKLKQLAFNSSKPKRLRKQKNAGIDKNQQKIAQNINLPKAIDLKNINLPKLRETFDRAIWNSEIFKTTQLLESHIDQNISPAMIPIDSGFKPKVVTVNENLVKKNVNKHEEHALRSILSPGLSSLVENLKSPPLSLPVQEKQLTRPKVNEPVVREEVETMSRKRTEELNEQIYAYVNICLKSPLRKEALDLVRQLSKQPSTNQQNLKWLHINNIEIYNTILLDSARRSDLKRCTEFYAMFRTEAKLKPNVHSIAASLLAIGNLVKKFPDENVTLKIHQILKDADKFEIDLKEIFRPTDRYMKEELDLVLNTIKISRPEFDIEVKDNELYSNYDIAKSLLSDLYENTSNSTRKLNDIDVSNEKLIENIKEQFHNELENRIKIPSIFKQEKKDEKFNDQKLRTVKQKFLTQLKFGYRETVKQLNQSTGHQNQMMYAFLNAIPEAKCLQLMLQEIEALCQGSLHFTPNYKHLYKTLGEKFEATYNRVIQSENIEKLETVFKQYIEEVSSVECNLTEENHRQKFMRLLKVNNVDLKSFSVKWSPNVHAEIGRNLYEIIIKHVHIKQSELLKKDRLRDRTIRFQKVYRPEGIYKNQQILVDPLLSQLFVANAKELSFGANLLPMITPPVPWITPEIGGYLLTSSNLLRLERKHPEQYDLIKESDKTQMYPIYDSLNALSSCPWKINTEILDLMIKIFNGLGNEKLGIPLHESKLPKKPKFEKHLPKDEYLELRNKLDKIEKQKSETYSLWCTELYRLSIANKYRDKIIYFPHSLDFRGRTYPIPPHFSHLGSDISRSLIKFAEGRPLGKRGFEMLKVHLVNLTGLKKRNTIDERLAYADSIIADIIDSAENPLHGRLWWQESEEPWQTLACCIEIRNAIKSGSPFEYISHYPIHQDGSCNGLQHYAALGRDEKGAESVNLNDAQRPRDVYSDVAELVENKRKLDANMNDTDELTRKKAEIAKVLEGHVNRKVIKQTVMTTVYNVTKYGARLQILRQLEDKKDFPAEFTNDASTYLADQTFDSIQEVFEAASKIQDWFCECAHLLTKLRHTSVPWVTPLGLPIIQPYYRKKRQHDYEYKKLDDELFDEKQPNSKKNQNAFPPNFIHSLDSTHMMLTSLYCQKENIRFVSVHDCFWTHACDTDAMNKICREQFIKLHQLELLENLAKYFSNNFKFSNNEINNESSENRRKEMIRFNELLEKVPQKGNFNLNKVLNSIYFFS